MNARRLSAQANCSGHFGERPRGGRWAGRGLRLLAQPYRGKQAAGVCAFFAVAEEQTGVAGGAQVADENVAFAKASGEQLRAIGFA